MTDQDNARALLAIAQARGIYVDPDATHLSLQQVAQLADESEITTRRAVKRGDLPAEIAGWRYQIPILAAAAYVVGMDKKTEKEGA